MNRLCCLSANTYRIATSTSNTRQTVLDIDFEKGENNSKQATCIHRATNGKIGSINLGEEGYVLTTIGSLTENSDLGDQHTTARFRDGPAPAWDLWRRIAAKDPAFGCPDVSGAHVPETQWESATVTTLDSRIWVYGLLVERPGDFVKKPMKECTGEEITQEWLHHLGVPPEEILELAAEAARCVPVMMPYVMAFFMPRAAGDRPDVVPKGAKNFAFLGQFAETSVRTGMQAAYQLMDVDRGIPEVFGSTYDTRTLLDATMSLRDHRELVTWLPERSRKFLISKLDGTAIGDLLREHSL